MELRLNLSSNGMSMVVAIFILANLTIVGKGKEYSKGTLTIKMVLVPTFR